MSASMPSIDFCTERSELIALDPGGDAGVEEGFRVGLGHVDSRAGLLALEVLDELYEHRGVSVARKQRG
jgi:hypothetical protein